MRDPKIIDTTKERIPDDWRRHYAMRPLEKLPQDVTQAFDRIWTLQREKDVINRDLGLAHRRLDSAGIKLWIMGLFLAGEGAVILWLVDQVLKRI